MAFVDKVPDSFAGGQFDRPILRKIDHASNRIVARLLLPVLPGRKVGQSSAENFIHRPESTASELLADDSLLFGF